MFAIPSLQDLVARARAAFDAHLPGVLSSMPGNNIGPTAKVWGETLWDLFGRLRYVHDQIFLTTADFDHLVRHGDDYGMSPRSSAVASGIVSISHLGNISVAAGARVERADGFAYQLTESYASGTEPGSVNLLAQAVTPALNGNAPAGTSLSIAGGVSGAGAAAATAAVGPGGMAGGLDVEDAESFRARLLFRRRFAPHGGSAPDYARWVMEVPGVTRVFVERLWAGPGSVRVFPLFDESRPGGIPTPADLELVRATLAQVQPAAAGVTVAAAGPLPIEVTISGLAAADAETRSAISASLGQTVRARGAVAGSDEATGGLPFLAVPFSFSRSWISEAISSAAGEARHVLVAPADDIAVPAGAVPVLSSITYV